MSECIECQGQKIKRQGHSEITSIFTVFTRFIYEKHLSIGKHKAVIADS